MTKEDKSELIKWGLILGAAYLLINKVGNIFSGGSPAPGINSGLNPAFTETANNHRKYTYSIHTSDAQDIAETIHNALGLISDDYPTVIGALKGCTTQGDVFQVSQTFQNVYGQDLYTFLQTGAGITPADGLSNAHLNSINDYVNSLAL